MAGPAVTPLGLPRPVVAASALVVRRGGQVILDGLTFTIASGRVTGLLGPSGCGKTTLMRALVGVQMISAGQLELLGLPAGAAPLRHRVGYATQDPAVYTDLSLAENLRYFGTVLGLARPRLADAIARTVAELDLLLAVSLTWLGVHLSGSVVPLVVVAVLDALLGMSLGLFASAFARTEFQAVQFMPAFVLPQVLLCGIVVARDQMAPVLRWLSGVLPMSYAVDAMQQISTGASWSSPVAKDIGVILGFTAAALIGGALTLRRRTR